MMDPGQYGVCVAGGHRVNERGRPGYGTYEAEAIVWQWGGRTAARFIVGAGGGCSAPADVRAKVERRARAWIAADEETRAKMQAAEHAPAQTRTWRWKHWWPDG